MKKHNHITRDIKPIGQCPACDEYHDRNIPKKNIEDNSLRLRMNKLVELHFDTDSITEMYHKLFIDMAVLGYKQAIKDMKNCICGETNARNCPVHQ